ncbi:4-hydroxy-tetrahydrodipicolinate synthase [Pandoraea fibrosis]|uniref:4-hydroxy-tetrahydrodipicolinate synthase n=1 Tax=Pandoraea fibrosis TaxID=1891094 RepID=A0A5E4VHX3_9BURK|nr:4-hydroxy-tetrahydrodipicolinate synthase [Pandoraea fibrosis]VVE11882.1 4-hydroxy-tetrahydrodipicolinate synthase [Pandoraea fibrosis]
MTQHFHGVIPAMVTPFDANGHFDEARTRELIEGYLAAGVHGISVAGSQGEFYFLSFEEHVRLIEIAVQTVNGRVPVYAGTGAPSTRQSIALTQAAESIGADLALVITPYFVQPNDDELFGHFRAVAQATRLPVMIYNNPPRTAVDVSVGLLKRCMEVENIVGIKDSSGDLTQFAEYMRVGGKSTLGFCGRDTLFLSMLLHGGSGAISPAANVFPERVLKLYELARAGQWEAARAVHNVLAPLRAAWALGSFPVVIKEAMALVGRDAGPARGPIEGLPQARRAKLREVLETIQASA